MVVGTENAHAAADWVRVHQVLRNLVSNALLHGGDDIAVSVQVRETLDDGEGEAPPGHVSRRAPLWLPENGRPSHADTKVSGIALI